MDFIILGGGCFGSFYTRQILRGQQRLAFDKIHVIDVQQNCQVFREHAEGHGKITYHIQDWKEYFLPYFLQKIEEAKKGQETSDQYVPPTFAPHVLMELFLDIFKQNHPQSVISPKTFEEDIKTPVDFALKNGTRALSFATWTCPASCIEPPTCPHTRGPKDWDMKRYLQNFPGIDHLSIFQCRHFAMGVGTIPVKEIVSEYLRFEERASKKGIHSFAMASVSSCHGLIGLTEIKTE